MVRINHPYAAVVIVFTILTPRHVSSTSSGSFSTRRTNLRRQAMRTTGEQATNIFLTDAEQQEVSPPVSDCLHSASSSEDCSRKEGCIWCQEPLYGLCLTKELAKKINFLPFFTCSNATLAIAII
mmetsp:Transcript_21771/g.35896  ORF Transcript_21771/g.35896 Transcript_21771/m.35896 type:complete len:125 (+) Transcript_21771:53-427(+)